MPIKIKWYDINREYLAQEFSIIAYVEGKRAGYSVSFYVDPEEFDIDASVSIKEFNRKISYNDQGISVNTCKDMHQSIDPRIYRYLSTNGFINIERATIQIEDGIF